MINSVAKALRLLEILDQADDGGLALGEIARRAGLKAPATHNLVATLVGLGFVIQDPASRTYSLGERAGALGRQRHIAGVLGAAARPVLDDLGKRLGETVLLTIYRARRRHTLVAVESAQALRVVTPSIVDSSFYSTATGRMLLALLPPSEREAVIAELGLPGEQWPDAAAPPELARQLEAIRSKGSVVIHRRELHICALAVALPLPAPGVVAALGCYYPAVRSQAGREKAVLGALREAAAAISLRFEAA